MSVFILLGELRTCSSLRGVYSYLYRIDEIDMIPGTGDFDPDLPA